MSWGGLTFRESIPGKEVRIERLQRLGLRGTLQWGQGSRRFLPCYRRSQSVVPSALLAPKHKCFLSAPATILR